MYVTTQPRLINPKSQRFKYEPFLDKNIDFNLKTDKMVKRYNIQVYEIKNLPYQTRHKENWDFTIGIQEYLDKIGIKTVFPFHPIEVDSDLEITAYHVDRATVVLETIQNEKDHDIQIKFVSKDNLDNVVNKILKKFPNFKRAKIS